MTRSAFRMPSAVALVPARGGSTRVPGKNVRPLGGHPLMAYAIAAAAASGLFEAVVVSTDDARTAEVARHYGAEVPALRPAEISGATSPDIAWVRHVLGELEADGRDHELFSILRPTSPFRGAATIRRAWEAFESVPDADSIRAVELCRQHPGKMWTLDGELMRPLLDQPEGVPYHSSQYQALPPVYIQNSRLAIAWKRVARAGSISGDRVLPFLTEGHEGFSVDYPEDFERAERLVAEGGAELPTVDVPPYAAELAR
jgi:CMP-N,N'-diacetyllegionaminic acid synthase